MKKISALLAGLVTCAVLNAAPSIFYVDMGKAYSNFYKAKAAAEQIQASIDSTKAEIAKMDKSRQELIKDIQAVQEKLKNPALTEAAKKKLAEEAQPKVAEIQQLEANMRNISQQANERLQQNANNIRKVHMQEIAEIVKKLYTMYSTGNYSLKELERYFYEQGYRNRNGNKLAHNTLGNIICNPKNMGYYVGGKVVVVDMFTKKQQFLPEEEWKMEYAPDIVPPIVDEDTWRKAFDIFKERSEDVKTNRNVCNKDNLLTGKMYCAHCGAPYYKREHGRWVCSYKKEHGKDSCPSLIISEDEIRPILLDVFRETSSASERAIRKMMQAFENMLNDNETEKAIRKYQKDLDKLTERKSKLLDLYLNDGISKADYNFKESEINEKIVEIEKTIKELDQGRLTKEAYADKLNTIRNRLVQAEKDVGSGIITPDFVKHYIDRINVSTEGNIINLEIILFSGIKLNSVIEKNGGRSGTMVKKMIQAYENGMK